MPGHRDARRDRWGTEDLLDVCADRRIRTPPSLHRPALRPRTARARHDHAATRDPEPARAPQSGCATRRDRRHPSHRTLDDQPRPVGPAGPRVGDGDRDFSDWALYGGDYHPFGPGCACRRSRCVGGGPPKPHPGARTRGSNGARHLARTSSRRPATRDPRPGARATWIEKTPAIKSSSPSTRPESIAP